MIDIVLLENTKDILRSLLISSSLSGGMSVTQLNIDYCKMKGRPIPYGLFGFNRLHLFLKSIPDTVRLVDVNDIQMTLVYVVHSEN